MRCGPGLGPLRRLPFPVPPARNESRDSYIDRLAKVNRLRSEDLWAPLLPPGDTIRRTRLIPERLAQITGYPLERLRLALPQLRPRYMHLYHGPMLACLLCSARHRGGQVEVFLLDNHHVCIKHKRWIDTFDHPWNGFEMSLSELPEVVTAQHKLWALIRRFSRHRISSVAPLARYALKGFIKRGEYCTPYERRMNILLSRKTSPVDVIESYQDTATFPEVVALIGFFASPYWRRSAVQHRQRDHSSGQSPFEVEVGRRIGHPEYRIRSASDLIGRWAQKSPDPDRPRAGRISTRFRSRQVN